MYRFCLTCILLCSNYISTFSTHALNFSILVLIFSTPIGYILIFSTNKPEKKSLAFFVGFGCSKKRIFGPSVKKMGFKFIFFISNLKTEVFYFGFILFSINKLTQIVRHFHEVIVSFVKGALL